ncbi:MAG TPA: hybrid sensor histidine kinase/response regulator [Polyangia bacterium]|jgi:signal transduction histidine kinase|nr:hybrid sensor histidine kinase/response regulator [Polyangia bacterium]
MPDRLAEPPATILVVDDNLQNREVAEGHLVGAGYQAVQAESGEAALALLQPGARRPDLVLLDVLMPGLDGFETCRRIRALPGGSRIPVLFLTALGDLGTHKAALDSGADDFLTKPINRTELLIRVRSLLRIKALSDEQARNLEVISSQRDALIAAQREKEELTALIIHDLKNPLSSILSNVQYALGQESLGTDERDSLRDVLRASQSMVRMVMNLLDVSRSEDGALVPHMSEFELPGLLREVTSEMERRIEDKDQRLELLVAPDVRVMTADRDLVRRIVENLVDNAYKYGSRRATIRIEAALVPNAGAPTVVELRVRDEGEPIPAAFRQKIFEKYARVEGRPAHEVRSSHGLGLVFCRRAVEIHGGQIWVEENVSRGNCFCVRLALRPGASAGAEVDGAAAVTGSAALSI